MKINPLYVGAGVAGLLLALWIADKLSVNFTRISEGLDRAALDYGQDEALAALSPTLLYDKARGDYARSLGVAWPNLTDWPSKAAWLDGEGPAGYRYGDPNYPVAEGASFWGSLWDSI